MNQVFVHLLEGRSKVCVCCSCTSDVLLLWKTTAWGNNRCFASKLTIFPKLSLLTVVSRHLSLTTWNAIWVFLWEWMLHSLAVMDVWADVGWLLLYSSGCFRVICVALWWNAALLHSLHNIFLVNQWSRRHNAGDSCDWLTQAGGQTLI